MIPERYVKLSFDDGPDLTTTPQLLDHLRNHGVRATFFVVGRNIVHPQGHKILERMAREGHQIGNHSYSHVHLTNLIEKEIEREIKQTEVLIGAFDRGIKLFRPPFGFHNPLVHKVAGGLGYRLVLWNVCALDWKKYYHNLRWVSHTMRQIAARQDCVVLAHDVIPSTVAHVPALIRAIRKLGDTEFELIA